MDPFGALKSGPQGLTQVPLVWYTDELDWEMYQICVDACGERDVRTIADFQGRVLAQADYAQKWNRWCDEMQAALHEKRSNGGTE